MIVFFFSCYRHYLEQAGAAAGVPRPASTAAHGSGRPRRRRGLRVDVGPGRPLASGRRLCDAGRPLDCLRDAAGISRVRQPGPGGAAAVW